MNVRDDVLLMIHNERERQEKIHPGWYGHNHGMRVLIEEVGEVSQELQKYADYKHKGTYNMLSYVEDDMLDELIHVAATATRWAEQIRLSQRNRL